MGIETKMTTEELYDKLKLIQKMKCKTQNVYDLSNCPIPDYPNCLETAQSCVHNSSF